MDFLIPKVGEKVLYNDKEVIIVKVIDIDTLLVEEVQRNMFHSVKINELMPSSESHSERSLDSLTTKEWEIASKRFEIIKPLLNIKTTHSLLDNIALKHSIGRSTLYRWLQKYKKSGTVSSLSPEKKIFTKNRLDPEVDRIIYECISSIYLTKSRHSINKVYRKVREDCLEKNLSIPDKSSIFRRIKMLSEEEVLRLRYGKDKADEKFSPITGHFPGADLPLSVIQIDHTIVDIILVDEDFRRPLKRPNLTIAIDVYSRMIVGFYLSFDPPGEIGTGLCIVNSMLCKEDWLSKFEVKGTWPCWGIMRKIHVDNAKEFRGKMLRRACQNYGINLEFRPVKKPKYGGHVERVIGTINSEVHDLPGTTFSNIFKKGDYDSIKKSSLTIKEFEKWLLEFIVNVYHLRNHSSINMSPYEKYKQGVIGPNTDNRITGIPAKITNERKLRFDFMPFEERTIQEYGVQINGIQYYSNVLRKYIHSRENTKKNNNKKQFLFRIDPRNISKIYFYDPDLDDYFDIPYKDTSYPEISKWEYNSIKRDLKKTHKNVNSDIIFQGYSTMSKTIILAELATKNVRRKKRLSHYRAKQFSSYPQIENTVDSFKNNEEDFDPNIEPFFDIDYE